MLLYINILLVCSSLYFFNKAACNDIVFASFTGNAAKTLGFDFAGSDKTVVFMPRVSELLGSATDATMRLVIIDNIQPHTGVCIGISVSEDNKIDGCVGDFAACMKSDILSQCLTRYTGESEIRLFYSYQTLKLHIYNSRSDTAPRVTFDTNTITAQTGGCQFMAFYYSALEETFRLRINALSIDHAKIYIYIENTPYRRTLDWHSNRTNDLALDTSFTELYQFIQSRSLTTSRLIVSIPSMLCLMAFDIERELLRKVPNWSQLTQSLAFDVDFKISMRPPTPTVTVSLPTIVPHVKTEDLLFFYAVYQSDTDALVSSTLLKNTIPQVAVLDIKACDKNHYVLLQAMYIDGALLLSRKKTFSPDIFCARYNTTARCFCPPPPIPQINPIHLKSAMVANLQKSNPASISTIPLVTGAHEQIVITTTAKAPLANCMALDLESGELFTPVSFLTEDGAYAMCQYTLNPVRARYRITHGLTVFENVLVCSAHTPGVQYVSMHEESVSFLKIDTGIVCPSVDHSGSVYKSKYSVSLFIDDDTSDIQFDNITNTYYVWFPPQGHKEIELYYDDGRTEGLVIDVTKDLSLLPVYCTKRHVAFKYNHLPRFATDHTAFADITIIDRKPNYIYSLQIIKNGHIGGWMQMRRIVTSILLESGTQYRFTVMVQEKTSPDALLVTSVCYESAGQINALPQISIDIVSPINIFSCDDRTLIVFQATTNAPMDLYGVIPYAHDEDIGIDIYTANRFIYVIGPLPDNYLSSYVKGALVLEFKFGTQGQVRVTTLDDIIYNQLYEMGTSSLVDRIPHGFDYKASRILADTCKAHIVPAVTNTAIGECTPLKAHWELVADDYRDWGTHDLICSGKRLFRLVFDSSGDKLTYKSENDPDIGSVVLVDGLVFALTAKRHEGVTAIGYFNPMSSQYMGVKLNDCASVIEPPSKGKLVWAFEMPHIRVMSSYESSCGTKDKESLLVRMQRPQKQQTAEVGGFIIKVDDTLGNFAGGVQTYTLSVESANTHVPVIARTKNPWMPMMNSATAFKGSLVYSGLDSGAYVAKLSVTDFLINSTGYTCHTRELLFVEPATKAFAIDDIVDMDKTSAGEKSILCPKNMYADTNSWLEYYTLTLNSEFVNSDDAKNKELTVNIWEKTTSELVKTAQLVTKTKIEGVLRYRLPKPGTYVAELIMTDTKHNTQCSHHLPEYSVSEPNFDKGSFVAEVISYPTCAESKDGLIRISYPEHITDVLATPTACYLYYDPSQSCLRDIYVDESLSTQGAIFVKNAPYMSRLTIEFEIHSSCVFTADYTVAPDSANAYVLTGIDYAPTCLSRYHMFVPAFFGISDIDDYYGITEATWSVGEKQTDKQNVVSKELAYVFDPAEWMQNYGGMFMNLEVVYNGGSCVTRYNVATDGFTQKMFLTPEVTIDPILFELDKSRSLPVYCPNSADAVLVATVYPPLLKNANSRDRLIWLDSDGKNVSSSSVGIVNENTVIAFGLDGGKAYTLRYSSGPCVATDSVSVPEKKQYNILNHLVIESANCSGGNARAYIDKDEDKHTGCSKSEVDVFTSDMIMSSVDRKYIDDKGAGDTEFTDVPDGTIIRMKIPYDARYKSTKPFCDALFEIDFGKVAPIPVKAFVQNTNEPYPLKLYTPPWALSSGAQQCVAEKIFMMETDWDFELLPLNQTMLCPYTQPLPVAVYKVHRKTGDRFFVQQYTDPMSFYSDLHAMDPLFNITYPAFVDVSITDDVTIIDAHCNREEFMVVGVYFSKQAAAGMKEIYSNLITVDNKPVQCYVDNSKAKLACRVPRASVFHMYIPYKSTTNGDCFVTVPLYYVVADLKYFVPKVVYNEETGEACLLQYRASKDTQSFRCFQAATNYGVYKITGNDSDCKYEYDAVVTKPYESGVAQIISPSCAGSSDGAIVWKMDNGTVVSEAGIPAGLYYVASDNNTVFDAVYLWDAEPVSYVVQPVSFPAPTFRQDAADVIGLPYSMSDPLDIIIYIRGGSELLDISIIGTNNKGEKINPECILRYYENVYWTYVCNSTLLPGYSYVFDVNCVSAKSTHSRRRPSVITTLEKLGLAVTSLVQPSTMASKDGSFVVEILGGVPPFTVLFENSAFSNKQLTRYIYSGPDTSSSGVYHVTVIDSTGALIGMDINMYPLTTFVIQSLHVVKQRGCGLLTRSWIKVELNENAKVDSLGAWNQATHESPVTSCYDLRMKNSDDDTVVVGESGDWFVAACAGGEIVAISDTMVSVPMQEQTLVVSLTNDGVMNTCEDARQDVALQIEQSKGDVIVKNGDGTMVYLDRGYIFTARPAGMYTFYANDESDCPVELKVMVKNKC